MNIIAISDLHGYLPALPACDLLLLSGDYCPVRDPYKEREFIEGPFTEWLQGLPAKHIVGIAGNHDFILEADFSLAATLPWTYLQDSGCEIEGLRIYGTPWTPTFGNWAFMGNEYKLNQKFKRIPEDVDILLTHGPAYRHLDRTEEGLHVGSHSLYARIGEVMPKHVICGHIHEAHGHMLHGDMHYWNVSHVNRDLQNVHTYTDLSLALKETNA